LSPAGTPHRSLYRPMRCPSHVLADVRSRLNLQALGLRFNFPVRVSWAKARERLPSCLELASRNLRAERARTFDRERSSAHRFAFCPLVPCVRQCFEPLPG
jgi:hypothetical protein